MTLAGHVRGQSTPGPLAPPERTTLTTSINTEMRSHMITNMCHVIATIGHVINMTLDMITFTHQPQIIDRPVATPGEIN